MALSKIFDCGGYYKKYDMTGDIHIGTGILRVHDIFNPLPEFMKEIDVLVSDPPCTKGNLNSFYTKADKPEDKKDSFDGFEKRYFECIDEIAPRMVFLETFKDNTESFFDACKARYEYVEKYDIFYYRTQPCAWIVASHKPIPDEYDSAFTGKNEDKCIEWVCENVDANCIGDLCMGTGLVGWYANKYGKKFAGTELNKKRLAMLVEGITTGRKVSQA